MFYYVVGSDHSTSPLAGHPPHLEHGLRFVEVVNNITEHSGRLPRRRLRLAEFIFDPNRDRNAHSTLFDAKPCPPSNDAALQTEVRDVVCSMAETPELSEENRPMLLLSLSWRLSKALFLWHRPAVPGRSGLSRLVATPTPIATEA